MVKQRVDFVAWESLKGLYWEKWKDIGKFKQKNIRFLQHHPGCSFEHRLFGERIKQEGQSKATTINQAVDDGCLDQKGGNEGNEH